MRLWMQTRRFDLLAPLVFLVTCVLAFGLQAHQLGFYLDDWIILNAYQLGGAERVFEYAFLGNRPLVFWLWVLGFQILHASTLAWQVWALLWRWLTVVMVWQIFRQLWPNAQRSVTLAALLFAIYPLFAQQASALTYSFHWICFFLWALSVYAMLQAVLQPRQYLLWMTLSVLTGALQLFSQEFFVGLELLRPLMLWMILRYQVPKRGDLVRRVWWTWLPFVVLLAAFYVWRTRLMPTLGADRNLPDLFYGLLSAPRSALPKLIEMFFQDLVHGVLGVWYATYRADLWVFQPISNVLAWGVAALSFAASLSFFWSGVGKSTVLPELVPAPAWYRTAIPFGLAAMMAGFLPGWMIGRHIYDLSGVYNDRFGLAAMFGAALVVTGLVEAFIKTERARLVLLCMLIGLGTAQNFRYETNYRWSWEKQTQFYWQLKWRAPDLKKPTAIYGEGALISYMGSWVTTSALVQMYGAEGDSHFMDFWYFDLTKNHIPSQSNHSTDVVAESNFMRFRAPAQNTLVIAFEPEKLHCLWVLGPADAANPYLTVLQSQSAPLSNLEQILAGPEDARIPSFFGPEPIHDWCYFYQKADLARQQQDWQTIVQLWNAAEQNQRHPRVGTEYLPFVEGFAHSGDWETAFRLSQKAYFPKYEMRADVCATWKRIAQTTTESPEKQARISQAVADFECQDEFR